MSIENAALQYLGLYEEPAGEAYYQVDHSGTPGDFIAVPYVEGSLDIKGAEVDLDPMTGKMRNDGMDLTVIGPKSCSASFAVTMHSHGQDLDGDVTPVTKTTWALLRALQANMGGMVATTAPGAQTQVQAGTSTTIVNVTTGHGARFQAGGAIGCEVVSGSGLIEAREILSVTDDAVTVKQAFSATPVTGSAVRGAITVYMTENPTTSLQLLREGREATDGSWYGGLQGGFSMKIEAGGLGQYQFAWQGARWGRVGSSAITIPSYTNYAPFALAPLEVTVPVVGSTTRVVLDQSDVIITPGIVYQPQKSGRAQNTIARMVRKPVRPLVQGSFTIPYETDTWFTARADREVRALFIQAGNVPGKTILTSVPTIQIRTPVDAPSGESIAGIQVPWVGRHDAAIGSTSELSYSAVRKHFL